MNIQKLSWLYYLPLVSISIFLGSCEKETEEFKGEPSLSFVESTIPEEVSAQGGTVSLEVEWAYTKWHVSAGDVVEGKEFITDIKPSYVGAENEGLTKTKVNLTISVNNTHSYNSQKLILRSLTNNFSDTIVIKQAAKPIEP